MAIPTGSLALRAALLEAFAQLLQVLGQRALGRKRPEEVVFFRIFLIGSANLLLDVLVVQDDIVVHGVFFQLGDDLQRMRRVHGEHAEKHADKERKRQIFAKPVQR